MLDMYALKKVQLNAAHIKNNKKLQKGHPNEYAAILIAEGHDEQANEFITKVNELAEETKAAMSEMKDYVN